MQKVNKFPLEIFPKEFQAIIQHNKEIQNFDTNLSALSYLSATATTIGNSVQIKINESYIDKPILWCVVVANSGMKKSHIMEFPYKFLKEQDRAEMQRFKDEIANIEKEKQKDIFTINDPEMFILKDSTPEALSKCLKANPKGVTLFKDEMARMVKDFNKYSNGGGEQDSLLELFNGNELSIHRANKPTLYLPQTCVNLIGGIQPNRLSLLANEDNYSSGFYYRLLFARPEECKPNEYVLEDLNKDILNKSKSLFQNLFNYKENVLTLSKDVRKIYQDWYNKNQKIQFGDEFNMPLQSKMETYLWRLCIVLDVLDQISTGVTRSEITTETMEKAIILIEFFRTESTEIFKDTFREGILESESEEFQKRYKKLANSEYSTQDLIKHFTNCLGADMINKKLGTPELFQRIKRGIYRKSILNVTK